MINKETHSAVYEESQTMFGGLVLVPPKKEISKQVYSSCLAMHGAQATNTSTPFLTRGGHLYHNPRGLR